jgi:hypothetical protein
MASECAATAPHSWFGLFTQMEGPPPNLAEWQAAIAGIDAR